MACVFDMGVVYSCVNTMTLFVLRGRSQFTDYIKYPERSNTRADTGLN